MMRPYEHQKGELSVKAITSLVLALIAIILFPTTALAHTELEHTFPADKEVVSKSLKEIRLTFEGNLEALSTLTIVDEAGKQIEPTSIDASGKELTATLGDELTNGDYKVNWKIAGTDGHVLEGHYLFTVDLPTAEKSETVLLPLATGNLGTMPSESKIKSTSEEVADADQNKLILLGLGVLILISNMVVFARKRRNV